MTYKTKSCPHCGKTYAWLETGRHYGSPIRVCTNCKQQFIDKDYREPALTSYYNTDPAKVSLFPVLCIVIGALLLFMGVLQLPTEDWSLGILFIIVGLLFTVSGIHWAIQDYKTQEQRRENSLAELQASERRLSNPLYARKLADLGYKVPEKYLINAQPIHTKKQPNQSGLKITDKEPSKQEPDFNNRIVDLVSDCYIRCRHILNTSSIKMTHKLRLDLCAAIYIVCIFAADVSSLNRKSVSNKLLDFIFESKYSDEIIFDKLSQNFLPLFRNRIDFYSSVISGLELHAHCLMAKDISEAHPVVRCVVAFSDCCLNPAYIEDYSIPCPLLSALDVFDFSSTVLHPLLEEFSTLYSAFLESAPSKT